MLRLLTPWLRALEVQRGQAGWAKVQIAQQVPQVPGKGGVASSEKSGQAQGGIVFLAAGPGVHHGERSRRSTHRIREGPRGSSVVRRHARNHQRRLERRDDGARAGPRPGIQRRDVTAVQKKFSQTRRRDWSSWRLF